MLQDDQDRYVRLETYIKKIESEKEEYENTIQTLRRKIVLLEEEPQINMNECYESTSKTSNDTLIHSIDNRVTSYILRQVNQQIQKMEVNEHTAGQTKFETPTTGVNDKHQGELTRDRINVNNGSPVHKNHNVQESSTYPCNQTPTQLPSVQNRYQESDIYLRNQIFQVPQNDYTRHSMENNIVHQYTQNVKKGSPGGAAILWKKEINHLIKVIQDGNKRLQCIEILDNNYKPLLIISAYLPTKGCHDLEEFKENVDQLFEIYQKYCLTHDILIGGDINEDTSRNKSDNRAKYIQQLIY